MVEEVLVRDYLSRLDAAAAGLPGDRRAELVGEVRAHIQTALAEAGRSDETTVRNILDRLGSPDEIVSGEHDQVQSPAVGAGSSGHGGATRSSQWGALEVIAVVLIGLAWPALFLPFGPVLWLGLGIVGLLLTWVSGSWSARQKVITTILVLALYVAAFAFFLPATGPIPGPGDLAPSPIDAPVSPGE